MIVVRGFFGCLVVVVFHEAVREREEGIIYYRRKAVLFQMPFRYLTSALRFCFVLNNLNSLDLCQESFSISYNFYMFSALSAVNDMRVNVAGHIFCMSYKGIAFDKKIICPSQLLLFFIVYKWFVLSLLHHKLLLIYYLL